MIKTNFSGLKKVRHGRISNLIYPEISILRTAFLELENCPRILYGNEGN